MSEVLKRWNRLATEEAVKEILPCCGSQSWARVVASRRPIADEASLVALSDEICSTLNASDWTEAFSRHPRIGERRAPQLASAQSAAWSAQEQHGVASAGEATQLALAEGNREYERRFGHVFIVCATGKTAPEVLDILRRRLHNSDDVELREAAEEQRKITNLRLMKWLTG